MKTLAKNHVCNHCVIGEKTFENILIGPGKLLGLSSKGPQGRLGREQVSNPFSEKQYYKIDLKRKVNIQGY